MSDGLVDAGGHVINVGRGDAAHGDTAGLEEVDVLLSVSTRKSSQVNQSSSYLMSHSDCCGVSPV